MRNKKDKQNISHAKHDFFNCLCIHQDVINGLHITPDEYGVIPWSIDNYKWATYNT